MFFGHRHNLIMPGRALDMSDGWETKRRRGPGHDWAVIRLAARGEIRRVEVDTAHFKGNYPDTCSLEAADAAGERDDHWHDFSGKSFCRAPSCRRTRATSTRRS